MSDHASKTKGLMWFAVICLLGIACAFGISPMVRAIPWSWEEGLARSFPLETPAQFCKPNPQAQALLKRLVDRIYPVQPDDGLFAIDVQVVRDPVINAYAQLGGKISVNSGLLKQAESAEELAGVLAHEMEHVHRRHILEGFLMRMLTAQGINMIFGGSSGIDLTRYFLNMSFTRVQESEADEGGLRRLQAAHVDNQGFRSFFERMEKSDSAPMFLSDHPSNRDRIEMVGKFDNHDVKPIMTPDEWQVLKSYCGEK